MRRVFKCITESFQALKEWRWLGCELLLSEADLEQLANAHPNSLREQCHQMLVTWRQQAGKEATMKTLVKALKACKLLEPVGTLWKPPEGLKEKCCLGGKRQSPEIDSIFVHE